MQGTRECLGKGRCSAVASSSGRIVVAMGRLDTQRE